MADRLARVRQKYGPEAIVGATSGAYFSRSVILALDAALDRLAQLDDQPGPVRRLPRRQRARHGPQHHPRRGHRQHALRADRRPQLRASPIPWNGRRSRPPRSAARASSSIDPKRTQAAQMADLWLAPQVGTDAALALAMVHVLIAEELYDKAFVARWCHGFDELAAAGRAVSAGRRRSASPACPPSRSWPRPACTPTDPPPSSAATASTPSAPACRRSAPITASSPSAATSTAPAATCACAPRAACAATSICCTCRSSASTPRPSSAPSAPTASRCGPGPRAGRRPATTPPSSRPC